MNTRSTLALVVALTAASQHGARAGDSENGGKVSKSRPSEVVRFKPAKSAGVRAHLPSHKSGHSVPRRSATN